LDGQVLLRWNADDTKCRPNAQYMVYDYSQGGGPDSNVKAPDPPITAGSSDGNVMFFFRSDIPKSDGKERPEYDKLYPDDTRSNTQIYHDYSKIRIVTTRNYSGFDEKNPGEPRSYLFSA